MALTEEEAWSNVRTGRDYWLEKAVDFYQSKPLLYDSLTNAQKTALANYRQALLDFPENLATYLDGEMPLDYDKYFPVQPEFFEHRQHTEETQTLIAYQG
tara:strand:- start:30 stop:329 length:300 start_codon:yes stop_codon:yes gene_type:complete